MKRSRAFVAMAWTAFAVGVLSAQVKVTQRLTDADLDALIVLGRADKLGSITLACIAERAEGLGGALGGFSGALIQAAANKSKNYNLTLVGSRGRIASAAWDATSTGRIFTRSDVPEEWRAPVLQMIASPRLPEPNGDADAVIPSPIRGVFIRAYGPASNIDLRPIGEPVRIPRVWKNAKGATVEYDDLRATFDLNKAINLPGDRILLSVVTDAGERTCERTIRNIENLVKDRKLK